MKKNFLATLCALSVTTCTAILSNNAHAATKAQVKEVLKDAEAHMTEVGKIVKPSDAMINKVNKFIDDCGDLTEDQYDAIVGAIMDVSAAVATSKAKSLEDLQNDGDFKVRIEQAVSTLKKAIPALEVELTGACEGTLKLNGATLAVDENFLKGAKASNATITDHPLDNEAAAKGSTKDAKENAGKSSVAAKNASTAAAKKSSKGGNAIKATGADIDLTAASLTSVASLLAVLGAMVVARKKRIFE